MIGFVCLRLPEQFFAGRAVSTEAERFCFRSSRFRTGRVFANVYGDHVPQLRDSCFPSAHGCCGEVATRIRYLFLVQGSGVADAFGLRRSERC